MSVARLAFRRAEDWMMLPYLFMALGVILGLHFLQVETRSRISHDAQQSAQIRAEIETRITDLQRVYRKQQRIIRSINLVNARQDVLIRQLQQKFPGQFQQPTLFVNQRVFLSRHVASRHVIASGAHHSTTQAHHHARPRPARPAASSRPATSQIPQPALPCVITVLCSVVGV